MALSIRGGDTQGLNLFKSPERQTRSLSSLTDRRPSFPFSCANSLAVPLFPCSSPPTTEKRVVDSLSITLPQCGRDPQFQQNLDAALRSHTDLALWVSANHLLVRRDTIHVAANPVPFCGLSVWSQFESLRTDLANTILT